MRKLFFLSFSLLFSFSAESRELTSAKNRIESQVSQPYVLPQGLGVPKEVWKQREEIEASLQSFSNQELEATFTQSERSEVVVYVAEELHSRGVNLLPLIRQTYSTTRRVSILQPGNTFTLSQNLTEWLLGIHTGLKLDWRPRAKVRDLSESERLQRLTRMGWPLYLEPLIDWVPMGIDRLHILLVSISLLLLILLTHCRFRSPRRNKGRDFA